ncbi:hypothetical protein [Chromobacterium phragmitis]|uniref:SPOR domain-containing protein n=1 Tax=Chromobacterium phragmitis TaxID=2202141 RepID=A0ABV0J2I9_9NEIS
MSLVKINIENRLAKAEKGGKFYQVSQAEVGGRYYVWSSYAGSALLHAAGAAEVKARISTSSSPSAPVFPIDRQRKTFFVGAYSSKKAAQLAVDDQAGKKSKSSSRYQFFTVTEHRYEETAPASDFLSTMAGILPEDEVKRMTDALAIMAGAGAALPEEIAQLSDDEIFAQLQDAPPAGRPENTTSKTNTHWATW